MRKTRIKVNVAALQLNEGQLAWLPKNPRQWTQDDIDKTVKSLQEDPDFIEDRPLDIVAAPQKGEFVVFCGNLRTIALGIIGTTETDAYLYEPERATLEEDRATIKRRAWKDNGQFGTWDIDIINSTEWADYTPSQLAGFGVPGYVYGDALEESGSDGSGDDDHHAQEDDFDENSDEIHVRCKTGDIWELGEHRLMCDDSVDLQQVKALMGGARADISFFSPPYNTGGIGKDLRKKDGRSKYKNYADDMSAEAFTEFLNAAIANAGAFSTYRFMNIQYLANNKQSVIAILSDNLAQLADIIVWDKGRSQPQLAVNVLNSEYEFVLCFSDKGNRSIGTIPFHGTLKNIVHINPGHNEFAEEHNAVFPVEFAAYFIEHFAKSSVLDLFGGTGTTLIAAEQLGRKCYMMELDPHYCDLIIARWEKLTGKTAVKVN